MSKYTVDWLEVARLRVFGYKRGFLRSVLKLDGNFHVYIHGNRKNAAIEKDENGTYLKLYFKTIK